MSDRFPVLVRAVSPRIGAVALGLSLATGCGDDGSGSPADTEDSGSSTTDAGSSTMTSAGTSSSGTTTASTTETTSEGTVSFASDVLPLLRVRCTLCHHDNSAIDIDIADPFSPPNGVVGSVNTWAEAHPEGMTPMLNIDPGNPDGSFLLDKIGDPALLDGPVAGGPMPWNVPPLTPDEIAALRAWIDAGANDDATFADTIRPIFGDETTLGAASGKCTWCHHSHEGGTPPNLTDPFDPTNGAVGVMSFIDPDQARITPGDADNSVLVRKVEGDPSVGSAMPMQFERLTADEVAVIEQWIAEGALDN